MATSGRTPNLELGTYVANDTTSWLQDFNRNMNVIDTKVGNAVTQIDSITDIAQNAESTAINAETLAQNAQNTANDAVSDVTTALSVGAMNADAIEVLKDDVTILNENAISEVVTITSDLWVVNTSDSRYPLSATVELTKEHSVPYAIANSGSRLMTDSELSFASTITQFLYDDEVGTITFYTTLADTSNVIDMSFIVRG